MNKEAETAYVAGFAAMCGTLGINPQCLVKAAGGVLGSMINHFANVTLGSAPRRLKKPPNISDKAWAAFVARQAARTPKQRRELPLAVGKALHPRARSASNWGRGAPAKS